MTRYLMAGLAMTASVVLLFLASFKAPHPVVPIPVESRTAPAAPVSGDLGAAASGSSAANSPEAVSALQDEIRKAARTLASLENQVTQTREDLATLQTQRKPRDETAQPAAPASETGPSASSGKSASAAPDPRSDPSGGASPAQSGPPATSPRPATSQGGAPAIQVPVPERAPTPSRERSSRGWPGSAETGQLTQPFGFPARQRPTETRQPEPHAPDTRSAARTASPAADQRSGDDEAVQAAMSRVRRQARPGETIPGQVRPGQTNPGQTNPGQTGQGQTVLGQAGQGQAIQGQSLLGQAGPGTSDQPREAGRLGPDPGAGPHRIPTIERLQDARAAVVEGRIEDARRFLQAAQVQLVFRPVGPGEGAPRASQAAGPVAQALMALGYGDRGRAVVAIDQAAGVLDPNGGAQQYGALPQNDMGSVSGLVRGP